MPESNPADGVYRTAIAHLAKLIEEARLSHVRDHGAAALGTATPDGRPSVRMVSVVRVGPSGLVFFADETSGKGRQLRQNPRAALCFHWPGLQQQAIVEGTVVMLPEPESTSLWRHLPREVGIGRWASAVVTRDPQGPELHAAAAEMHDRFWFERVPRPPRWQAFELRPERIETWETGWHRLRPRVRYEIQAGEWIESAAAP